jgi:hypothetical protein
MTLLILLDDRLREHNNEANKSTAATRLSVRLMSKSHLPRTRTAGHRAAAILLQFFGQPLGAPLRRYFNAHAATPYLCFRSRLIAFAGVDLDIAVQAAAS